jgi:hypothetical protein
MNRFLTIALTVFLLTACSSKPLVPYTEDTPPLILTTAEQAGITDKRGRFREIACAVLESHGKDMPHYRDCEEALTRVGTEKGATGEAVHLGTIPGELVLGFVPGIGWECFEDWLEYENEFSDPADRFGYKSYIFSVDGMSGSKHNARQIRDAIMENTDKLQPRQLILAGYSKGAPDILEAVVHYPEIHPYIAAVVRVAGAVGGSPLANPAEEKDLNMLRHIPKSECTSGDGHAVESLRPAVRKKWLAENPLPENVPFYSLVTYPDPENVSSILKTTWKNLAQVDSRNDSQVIFYDQVIPGSTLVGYLNADHWAIAVPIAESHPYIGKWFVDKNNYPREAMADALVRFIAEDLSED